MLDSAALTERISVLALTLDNPGNDLQAMLDVLTDDLTAAIPSYLGLTMTLHQVGSSITLTAINRDLMLTAEASLEIPLDAFLGSCSGGTVVCYARQSGSFVTLAAETGPGCRVDGQLLSRRAAQGGTDVAERVNEPIGHTGPSRAGPAADRTRLAHSTELADPTRLAHSTRSAGPTRFAHPTRLADPIGLADPAMLAGISGLGDLTVFNRAIGVLISRGESPAEAIAELLDRAARGSLSFTDVARQVLRSTNAPPSGPGSERMATEVPSSPTTAALIEQ